jgi:hypothetical protein
MIILNLIFLLSAIYVFYVFILLIISLIRRFYFEDNTAAFFLSNQEKIVLWISLGVILTKLIYT